MLCDKFAQSLYLAEVIICCLNKGGIRIKIRRNILINPVLRLFLLLPLLLLTNKLLVIPNYPILRMV